MQKIDIKIQNFTNYHVTGSKEKKKGRTSRGISVLVGHNYISRAEKLGSSMEEISWLKITEKTFIVIVRVVYRLPDESNYANKIFFKNLASEFDDLSSKYSSANFIIGGDFNARTSNQNENISNDFLDNVYVINVLTHPNFTSDRKSKDKVINNPGKQLLKFCHHHKCSARRQVLMSFYANPLYPLLRP